MFMDKVLIRESDWPATNVECLSKSDSCATNESPWLAWMSV
jgi:hypothetical protein